MGVTLEWFEGEVKAKMPCKQPGEMLQSYLRISVVLFDNLRIPLELQTVAIVYNGLMHV